MPPLRSRLIPLPLPPMRLLFHKLSVLAALSFLLAHNLIPHHHHDEPNIEAEDRHHEGDHDHDHLPFSFVHVDEVFLFKSFDLRLTAPAALAAVVPSIAVFREIAETKPSGFVSNPSGHPPSSWFFDAFSFRGPPIA